MEAGEDARRRIQRLQRIERLRRRLHELSEWRLAAKAHELEKLAADHAEMIAALGDGIMAYGPASLAGARRVRAIERELSSADVAKKDLARRALEEGRLAKLADRSLETARDAWREATERRSLEDLIDATVAASASHKPRRQD